MQEDQTVPFAPMNYEGPNPWYVNLFVIYLLCLLLITVVRAVRVMWALRKHRRTPEGEAPIESSSQNFWETCYAEIRSIRNFSHLTFLLAVLVLCWNATDILAGVANEKVSSFSYVAARFANALIPFLMGVILCSALFCFAMFLEHRVRRQRLMLGLKASRPQLPGQ